MVAIVPLLLPSSSHTAGNGQPSGRVVVMGLLLLLLLVRALAGVRGEAFVKFRFTVHVRPQLLN